MEVAASALVASIQNRSLIEPSSEGSRVAPSQAPSELAAARFAALMQPPQPGAVTAPDPTSGAAEATKALAGPSSLGERVLTSLQSASSGFKEQWQSVQSALQSDQTLRMREMMAMQLQVTQMSVQYELLGKVVSRSTQNVDQLVRIQ